MGLAALIIAVISLISSLACLVLMLAKNFFSTHVIQTQMVDPFKDMIPPEIGRKQLDPFQDIDLPLNEEEIAELRGKKVRF